MFRWLNVYERVLIVEMYEGRVKFGDIVDLLGMFCFIVLIVLIRWKKFGIIIIGNFKF